MLKGVKNIERDLGTNLTITSTSFLLFSKMLGHVVSHWKSGTLRPIFVVPAHAIFVVPAHAIFVVHTQYLSYTRNICRTHTILVVHTQYLSYTRNICRTHAIFVVHTHGYIQFGSRSLSSHKHFF